jgi:4-amino-4-deoxy-L-arabinose transferase-like glycosyltransferase
VSPKQHLIRIVLLMAAIAIYLTTLAAGTEVVFADGLRYISQAKTIDQGSWNQALSHAQDHPVYPLVIEVMHRVLGGDRPADWQAAAQMAAIASGVLLVVPLYLLVLELHGASAAWLACCLTFLVPLTGHVLADALSESTFLLFWIAGCWCSLRFLRNGSTRWLIAAIALGGFAYLTRPEGLLLPVALAGVMVATIGLPSLKLPGAAGRRAWAILVIGPLLVIGPYVAVKGGLGTKPAVGRLLGIAPRSASMAVERERPLDPDQSRLEAFGLACRGTALAVFGAVPPPLFLLALVGSLAAVHDVDRRRAHVFMGLILAAWLAAMVRLHVTSGYCTPRHALIFALPVIALSARGFVLLRDRGIARLSLRLFRSRPDRIRSAVTVLLLASAAMIWSVGLVAPINRAYRGYRLAGDWIAAHTAPDARVLDLKGWGLFYGQRQGYTFANLEEAKRVRDFRWVVAHDSFLIGPWPYCEALREAVGGRPPLKSFPEIRRPGVAQVHVFDLHPDLVRAGGEGDPPRAR